MEKITVTTYRGLSQVSGSISLPKLFEHMRGEIYRDRVRRIREALTSGDTGKADRMKKQLPTAPSQPPTAMKDSLTASKLIRISSLSTLMIWR